MPATTTSPRGEVDDGATEPFPTGASVTTGVNAPIKDEPTNEFELLTGTLARDAELWARFPALDPSAE